MLRQHVPQRLVVARDAFQLLHGVLGILHAAPLLLQLAQRLLLHCLKLRVQAVLLLLLRLGGLARLDGGVGAAFGGGELLGGRGLLGGGGARLRLGLGSRALGLGCRLSCLRRVARQRCTLALGRRQRRCQTLRRCHRARLVLQRLRRCCRENEAMTKSFYSKSNMENLLTPHQRLKSPTRTFVTTLVLLTQSYLLPA